MTTPSADRGACQEREKLVPDVIDVSRASTSAQATANSEYMFYQDAPKKAPEISSQNLSGSQLDNFSRDISADEMFQDSIQESRERKSLDPHSPKKSPRDAKTEDLPVKISESESSSRVSLMDNLVQRSNHNASAEAVKSEGSSSVSPAILENLENTVVQSSIPNVLADSVKAEVLSSVSPAIFESLEDDVVQKSSPSQMASVPQIEMRSLARGNLQVDAHQERI
jgi:hypothetical protein